jgi:hypothetical protein
MRKLLKRLLGLGVLAGIGYALWRAWQSRIPPASERVGWEQAPFPFPPEPRPAPAVAPPPDPESTPEPAPAADTDGWVEPSGNGSCPATHPVKAKVKSGIFHEPGGANYDRTNADRCYADATAAEADGLRRSKH